MGVGSIVHGESEGMEVNQRGGEVEGAHNEVLLELMEGFTDH